MTVVAAAGVGSGLLGFLVVVALAVAAVFLFRSMLHHMRKVPPTFDEPAPEETRAEPTDDGPPPV